MPELLTSRRVRQVHLDQAPSRPGDDGAGVPDGIRVVGEGGRVEDDVGAAVGGLVQPLDELGLAVGLAHRASSPRSAAHPRTGAVIGEGRPAVDVRLAGSQPVEVGAVEDQDAGDMAVSLGRLVVGRSARGGRVGRRDDLVCRLQQRLVRALEPAGHPDPVEDDEAQPAPRVFLSRVIAVCSAAQRPAGYAVGSPSEVRIRRCRATPSASSRPASLAVRRHRSSRRRRPHRGAR